MNGTKYAYSALPSLLLRKRMSVPELYKRLESGGQHFDRKSVYRLASDAPLQTLNMPLVGAVCEELQVELQHLISLAPPFPKMARMEAVTQDRLDELMGRNTEGKLTVKERQELERLLAEAERLSLENARLLAGHGKKSKTAARPRPVRAQNGAFTSKSSSRPGRCACRESSRNGNFLVAV